MCGHITIFSKQDSISADALNRGMNSLQHRGPDAQKHWIHRSGRIGMGHTRLSIIDLSSGDQPIQTSDEKICAVVNGEFYGYEEIRKNLIHAGHPFLTHSDSEILLHLY